MALAVYRLRCPSPTQYEAGPKGSGPVCMDIFGLLQHPGNEYHSGLLCMESFVQVDPVGNVEEVSV